MTRPLDHDLTAEARMLAKRRKGEKKSYNSSNEAAFDTVHLPSRNRGKTRTSNYEYELLEREREWPRPKFLTYFRYHPPKGLNSLARFPNFYDTPSLPFQKFTIFYARGILRYLRNFHRSTFN